MCFSAINKKRKASKHLALSIFESFCFQHSGGFSWIDRVSFSPPCSFDLNAAKHHHEFGRIDFEVTINGSRQLLKSATLESLRPDRKSIAIPYKDLDIVAPSIEENEQVTGEQVHVEMFFDEAGQATETFAHVGRGGVDKDSSGRCNRDHKTT
jgi:hypothetical protein